MLKLNMFKLKNIIILCYIDVIFDVIVIKLFIISCLFFII
jgi:hypothetical protein